MPTPAPQPRRLGSSEASHPCEIVTVARCHGCRREVRIDRRPVLDGRIQSLRLYEARNGTAPTRLLCIAACVRCSRNRAQQQDRSWRDAAGSTP